MLFLYQSDSIVASGSFSLGKQLPVDTAFAELTILGRYWVGLFRSVRTINNFVILNYDFAILVIFWIYNKKLHINLDDILVGSIIASKAALTLNNVEHTYETLDLSWNSTHLLKQTTIAFSTWNVKSTLLHGSGV